MESRNREVALLVSLITLLLYLKVSTSWLPALFIALVAGMLFPVIFTPLTNILLFVGPKIQELASPIILNLIYFVFVLPVGLVQRLSAKKNGEYSILLNKKFSADDLKRPF